MAEYIKVPAGVYDMVTRCMEQEFPDRVAIRYVAEDGKTVVEKKYREYAQDIRRMTAYLKAEVPDIKGRRIVLLSRNCYEFCVASFGIILAGGVLVTLNQKKTWDELEYELGLVEPSLIVNDGIDYGCRPDIEAAYGDKLRPMDAFKDSAPAELVDCVGHDDLMVLMFTSGTTGRSKAVMLHLGKQYHRLGIAMQIHYNCLRGVNRKMNALLGPDTGYDMINTATCGGEIASLLSALNDTDECPKTIIYSLNPADDAQIGTILGCFQNSEVPGKIQHGSAWWFNDHKIGMEEQMTRLASLGLLGNFVGMLTDSRSFLSYTRHDYFRRILCNIIGQWVEDGEYPNDEKALEKIVKGICFDNAKRYFNL